MNTNSSASYKMAGSRIKGVEASGSIIILLVNLYCSLKVKYHLVRNLQYNWLLLRGGMAQSVPRTATIL
jgi:hypothetical protein